MKYGTISLKTDYIERLSNFRKEIKQVSDEFLSYTELLKKLLAHESLRKAFEGEIALSKVPVGVIKDGRTEETEDAA